MRHSILSDEVKDFIAANVKGMTTASLTKLINDTFHTDYQCNQIRGYKKRCKLTSDINTKENYKKNRPRINTLFTPEQEAFIKEHYRDKLSKELTDFLNYTFQTEYTVLQVRSFKKRYKLSSGVDTTFKKGTVNRTYEKGTYAPGSEKGWFKKGQTPTNHKPVGSERITDGYVLVKVAEPNKWRHKHLLVWEQHYGDIPKGYKIMFLDSNPLNLDINNLACISNDEMVMLNQMKLRSLDPEITKVAITLVKVKKRVNQLNKNK